MRDRDEEGRIVATLEDYDVVRELVGDLIAEGVEATVSLTVRETVEAVVELVATHPGGVTYKMVAGRLGLDLSVARRRAKDAQARGYLVNEETGRGRPAKLVLGDKLPEEQRLLPTMEELAAGMLARKAEGSPTSHLLPLLRRRR